MAARGPSASLGSALRVSLQSTGQAKNKTSRYVLWRYMKLEVLELLFFYHLRPSFSSPLLFSSSPLESGRSVVSSSPVRPSAHSCQTYSRGKRRCHRTMKRLFQKYSTPSSMSYFISVHLFASLIISCPDRDPQLNV